MSLIKQLWIAVVIMTALAFGGSFIISTASTKNYLEQQLQMKNIDNASSLALSLSQMEKDPVTVSLMLSAQFDTGHYRYIGLTAPDGKIISEHQSNAVLTQVPTWFTRLIPIHARPGIAQVNDGWTQYGTIKLESHSGFAYRELWNSTWLMLFWSLGLAIVAGFLGGFVLRAILHPLDNVVHQAEAIAERKFISTDEPKTLEFKAVVAAMNRLSGRIRNMLEEESGRLEQLRIEASFDKVSGLVNRHYFTGLVQDYIGAEDSFNEGVLIVSHLSGLAEINQRLGQVETDALLTKVGNALKMLCQQNPSLFTGRLIGADFAVFSKGHADIQELSSLVKNTLTDVVAAYEDIPEFSWSTTASRIGKQDQLEGLKSLVEAVKFQATIDGLQQLQMTDHDESVTHLTSDITEWHSMLTSALKEDRLMLASYPVITHKGELIHQESPVRLQLVQNGPWIAAGDFISWANRLDLMTKIDNLVIEHAFRALGKAGIVIGLNISTRAICNKDFVSHLITLIKKNPDCADRLWLDIPEKGAFEHFPEFRQFCARIKPFGCKIGLEHVGGNISRLGELHDLGLDYIKVDASIIRGIDSNSANKAFLRGLCMIAHSIGLITIAEGVQSKNEISSLPELGIDGMTGPAIRLD